MSANRCPCGEELNDDNVFCCELCGENTHIAHGVCSIHCEECDTVYCNYNCFNEHFYKCLHCERRFCQFERDALYPCAACEEKMKDTSGECWGCNETLLSCNSKKCFLCDMSFHADACLEYCVTCEKSYCSKTCFGKHATRCESCEENVCKDENVLLKRTIVGYIVFAEGCTKTTLGRTATNNDGAVVVDREIRGHTSKGEDGSYTLKDMVPHCGNSFERYQWQGELFAIGEKFNSGKQCVVELRCSVCKSDSLQICYDNYQCLSLHSCNEYHSVCPNHCNRITHTNALQSRCTAEELEDSICVGCIQRRYLQPPKKRPMFQDR